MTAFRFEEGTRFPENCEAFLKEVQALDPELANILIDNWDALLEVAQAGERDLTARRSFNLAVVAALDSLVNSPEPEDAP